MKGTSHPLRKYIHTKFSCNSKWLLINPGLSSPVLGTKGSREAGGRCVRGSWASRTPSLPHILELNTGAKYSVLDNHSDQLQYQNAHPLPKRGTNLNHNQTTTSFCENFRRASRNLDIKPNVAESPLGQTVQGEARGP